jgi:5-methyltetrahydropteroyltriglutamate--homocysteine methyltransferase
MTIFHVPGFPRLGAERQLKWALERYWKGDIQQQALLEVASDVRKNNWQIQLDAGVDWLAVGDFALYDHVLNTSYLLGHLPARARVASNPVDQLFLAARGREPGGLSAAACSMTKWFDTNYHYLVPECSSDDEFHLQPELLLEEIRAARQLASHVKPVVLGPLSYLYLGRSQDGTSRLELLPRLLPVYSELFALLKAEGIEWVQLDEPVLALNLPAEWLSALEPAYHSLRFNGVNVLLASYFDGYGPRLTQVLGLPVQGVHVDLVSGSDDIERILDRIGPYKVLSAGVISGRNIWRTDLQSLLPDLQKASDRLGERLWLSSSCSLLHVPYDASAEHAGPQLPATVLPWLAFARQKLDEGRLLANALSDPQVQSSAAWLAQQEAIAARQASADVHKPVVKARVAQAAAGTWLRDRPYAERAIIQQQRWQLPILPTTTIGSFPQTPAIRQLRATFRQGLIGLEEYESGLRKEIVQTIQIQEQLGLDVLVHGEAERNDMVEYFGELLEGIAVSRNGWVQSYGSRCVKPPIIFGDIERPKPMTVRWSQFAQGLSASPVKGMLTGPVTLLKWAFVRDDQPWADTAYQLAAVLRDEVRDLEAAGIGIIQVDEPGLREALPLNPAEHSAYLEWAVNSFRYATTGVAPETQIHTHMCYADFDDILPAIEAMDADVITLETARAAKKLLNSLQQHPYQNGIGPGVYDIHSPNVPTLESMAALLTEASAVVPLRNLWVNPDCGLKTRRWEEVIPSLQAMVTVAKALREGSADVVLQGGIVAEKEEGQPACVSCHCY